MEYYEYIPLNEEKEEVRMVTLHPGPLDSPIRVSLSNVRFQKASANKTDIPDFEAISYAWGCTENTVDIIIQSPCGSEGSLSVTRNLAAALPHLRYPDRSRTIWVDAIAVNQKDLSERSSQVRRMADIFTKARRVIVWLGCETTDTALALDYISAVSSRARVDWASLKIHAIGSDKYRDDRSIFPQLKEREASALLKFFSSSWFERLWIRQEIQRAPPDSIVACGSLSIPWESVRNSIFLLHSKYVAKTPSGLLLKERNSELVPLCNKFPINGLEELLYITRSCNCTDPRDRIFALLSMVREDLFGLRIETDYTKAVPEVYKDAVVQWSTFRGNLRMLQSCSLGRRLEGAPSWVPNFMTQDSCESFSLCMADAGTSSVFETQQDDVLEVLGLPVARIRNSRPSSFPMSTQEEVMLALKSITEQYFLHNDFSSKNLQSMCRVVMSGICAERWFPPREDLAPSRDQTFQILSEIQTTGLLSPFTPTTCVFLDWVAHWLRGRATFITEDGRLGLGPREMRAGDVVAISSGQEHCYYSPPSIFSIL